MTSVLPALLRALRRLLPGILLITAAAGVLLFSDQQSRRGADSPAEPVAAGTLQRIAILQHSSSQVMDELREGFVQGLATRGWAQGDRLVIDVYNAQGDLPVGNTMASRLAAGDYRLVATISTPMLQAFANANRSGRSTHVFMGVTAPVEAGVGIARMDSTDKPAWMAGIGSAQPVDAIFREARRLRPSLRVVGVVWNPSEINSEICTKRARAVSAELGIELLEAPTDGSQGVREAAESLVSRGAEAIWTGGDASVLPAIDSLIGVATKAGIPVFSNMAGQVQGGSTFDLGADYREVGRDAARLTADILDGADVAQIPIRNFMPERLLLNERAAAALRVPMAFDEETRARADGIVDAAGVWKPSAKAVVAAASASSAPAGKPATSGKAGPSGKPKRISAVLYMETPTMEQGLEGFREGLAEAGLVDGRDFDLRIQSAQGDMAILSGLVDGIVASSPDLIAAFSTPSLQTVLNKVKNTPAIFAIVADPFAAGAGTSDANHLPGITGVYMAGPFREMAALLKKHFPTWKRVGTLFCPAETNSVANEGHFRKALAEVGIALESVAAPTPVDLPDAAAALLGRPIDAVVQINDNLGVLGLPAVAKAATRARKPLFAFTRQSIEQGASVAIAMEYHDGGKAAATVAARVLRGESTASIPFENFRGFRLMVSQENARKTAFSIPAALVAEAADAARTADASLPAHAAKAAPPANAANPAPPAGAASPKEP